ncbi:MAG: type II toxin-antitoxin system PemK/MazF family toxin [Pirellulaceae bacterium]|jgi:mRNA interferase MazF|nr:type II toxin-antitoxin system PemK/MazF family toxin [Pirellulaceae bacterium]
MTRFPHASGMRGKKRPALVVQADNYNTELSHVLVAEITSNLAPAMHPAFVLIDNATADGKAAGLEQNSLVSGLFLATIFQDRIDRVIGKLSTDLMDEVDVCLKSALGMK